MTMNLRQQLIEDQVDKITDMLGVSEDHAFLRFAHHLLTGHSLHAFNKDDLVDGGQDKQIDVITIDDDGSSADLWILQTKYSPSFSSNNLIQMGNGLRWLFEKPRREVATLINQAFKDKIYEFRSVRTDLGPSNLRVHVAFVTAGSTEDISDEFEQELRAIRDAYSGDVFESFEIEPYGHDELLLLLKERDRKSKSIDADLKIKYDINNPSLIRYHVQGLKGLICTVSAQEIARIVNDDPSGSVFDLNLRRFLGGRGAVNKDIMATCSSYERGHEFWFLNNGVTIVCDSFDPNADPDYPHIRMKNLQIVNGSQTAATLAVAQREGLLSPDVRVMVRVYETAETDLVDRIVLTTNNQNRISSRDLRANDAVQIDMERGFEIYGLLYERKVRQHDLAATEPEKIVPNESVGQWYLAAVLKNPADARGRKYKVWGEHYDKVFAGRQRIEPYVLTSMLGRRTVRWIDDSGLKSDPDDVKRMLAKRGGFHIGRIAAFLWKGDDRWDEPQETLASRIEDLLADGSSLDEVIAEAFNVLEQVIRDGEGLTEDIDRALKSYTLNEAINKKLHTSRAARNK